MSKKIDFSKSVFELVQQYPELVDIMASLGFSEIKKKVMLHSVGKLITIPKGAVMRGISVIDVITRLQEHGFEITDRKSTRLNSSHANISYAVFCLKKKKNKCTTTGWMMWNIEFGVLLSSASAILNEVNISQPYINTS